MNCFASNGTRLNADDVKAAANGRWVEILTRAGIPEELLDGKGHPCPVCRDGDDRFAAFGDVNERGAVNCRECETRCGDGLATLQWLLGCDFPEALRVAAACVGLAPDLGVWSLPTVRSIRPSYGSLETLETSSKQPRGDASSKRASRVYGTPGDAERTLLKRNPTWSANGAWDYSDADGGLVFTVTRFDLQELDKNGKRKKVFRQIVPCEGGFTIGGAPESDRPLYSLPTLAAAPLVFVSEGEKACDALRSLGLIATTSPFGAKSAAKTDFSPLGGRTVVLLPDNDEAGEAYLERVAGILAALPDPPKLKILRLPNLPEGGDAYDWLEDLESKNPEDLKKEILRMAEEAEMYSMRTEVRTPAARVPATGPEKVFTAKLSNAAKIGVVGDFLDVIAPHTESSEVAILVQALTGIGNCLGRTVFFRVGGDRHHANLFTAIVGKSARARKGTGWGCTQLLLLDVDADWGRNIASGLSSGEGLISAVRDPSEVMKRGKLEYDPGVADKRLLAVETELGRTFTAMNRPDSTLSAVMRLAWDGTQTLRTMALSNGQIATNPHISIIGHIVEQELRSLLRGTNLWNGLANRILWIYTQRSGSLPFGGDLDLNAISGLSRRVSLVMDAYRGREVELPFHADARELWGDVYDWLARDRGGVLDAITSRAEAQTRRIALIYAALDKSDTVRRRHLEAALAIWEYGEASAAFIFGGGSGDPKRDRLLQAIRQEPGLSKSDLHQLFNNNLPKDALDRLIASLEHDRLVERKSIVGDGPRPTECFFPVVLA